MIAREKILDDGFGILAGIVGIMVAVLVGGVALMAFPELSPGWSLAIGAIPGLGAAAWAYSAMQRRVDAADQPRE